MISAKTIQIFLPDGNPRSVKIAEITSRTIQAVLIPRSNLDYALSREELRSVGVYFLIGNSDENVKETVYVGEAEDCVQRLKQHNASKDFWRYALVVLSKTKYFTKTHIKFLEWYSYTLIAKANRYELENGNFPSKPFVSEPVEADLIDNFDTIRILCSTLGFPFFEEIVKPHNKDILVCKGKDGYAEGQYTEDGLIVFAKSKCNLAETRTVQEWIKSTRKKLLKDKILIQEGDVLVFSSDYIFNSPSAASATVLGRSSNGWNDWKTKDGKTLHELKRAK